MPEKMSFIEKRKEAARKVVDLYGGRKKFAEHFKCSTDNLTAWLYVTGISPVAAYEIAKDSIAISAGLSVADIAPMESEESLFRSLGNIHKTDEDTVKCRVAIRELIASSNKWELSTVTGLSPSSINGLPYRGSIAIGSALRIEESGKFPGFTLERLRPDVAHIVRAYQL